MKNLFFSILLLPALLNAQEDSTYKRQGKFVRFISISGFVGGDFYREGFEDRTIFQQAAPNSTLATADLSGYSNQYGMYYFNSRLAMTNGINVNLRLRCQQKFGELRFGLAHSTVNVSSQYYSKENSTRIASDTLTNGDVFHTDSIATSSFNYAWNADIIHLHLGWIVRTDPKRWINLYTGFGLFGGIGFNGIISASHVHSSYHQTTTTTSSSSAYHSNYETQVLVTEKFRAPSFNSFGAYIPIGMNIRMGRRNDFLKHVALFGEYNGAIQFIMPKNVDSKVRTVSAMYGGVRWYIHAPGGGRNGGRHHRHNQDGNSNPDHNHDHN